MACRDCLARGSLLRALAARIERGVDRGAGRRARDLLALDDEQLARAVDLDPGQALGEHCSEVVIDGLEERLELLGCWAVCRHEPGWPGELERLGGAAPRALFGRGRRSGLATLADGPSVTVVGSRRAGPYGLEVAATLAEELAAAAIPVLSGMALGIDTAAHQGALRGEGFTAAVLGSGPERAYPRSRTRLHREIVASGLVLSELPPGSPTFRWTFPARNRIMAALAEITIVVEAAERSGSLITTEMAADCGRLVGAVPGPVNSWRSAGANMLIADGAAVVRDARDVLDHLLGPGAAGRIQQRSGRPLSLEEAAVLDAIEAGAAEADAVAAASGLGAAAAMSVIARLELAGYVELDFAGAVHRTGLALAGRTPEPGT